MEGECRGWGIWEWGFVVVGLIFLMMVVRCASVYVGCRELVEGVVEPGRIGGLR